VTARTVVPEAADIVTLLLALDMLSSYATTHRTVAVITNNKLKAAAMQAMLDHIGRLRTLLR
jgi:hypothetical protein